MDNLFKNRYRRDTARLKGWDYRQNAVYFVTICAKDKTHFFGEIDLTDSQSVAAQDSDLQLGKNSRFIAAQDSDLQLGKNSRFMAAQDSDLQLGKNSRFMAAQDFAPLRSYLNPTPIGQIAYDYWLKVPQKYPFINLGDFIIMPNHVHGILIFNRKENLDWQANQFGPQYQNLGAVIRGYKAGVKSFATRNQIPFGWQSRFHDHIIRDQRAFDNISRYIRNNPKKWHAL